MKNTIISIFVALIFATSFDAKASNISQITTTIEQPLMQQNYEDITITTNGLEAINPNTTVIACASVVSLFATSILIRNLSRKAEPHLTKITEYLRSKNNIASNILIYPVAFMESTARILAN